MAVDKRVNQKNPFKPDDIRTVEAYLSRTLRPVKPREDFVTGLRERIIQQPLPKKYSISVWQSALLITAGVLSGLLIVIASIRGALTLIDSLKVLKQSRQQARS
jgi:hypothetical protein